MRIPSSSLISRVGFLPFDWLIVELLGGRWGLPAPQISRVGFNPSTPNSADYEVMKCLEDFQLTSGGRCVLYKGTGRTSFWLSEEAKWSGEA